MRNLIEHIKTIFYLMQTFKNYYFYFLIMKKKSWFISNNDIDISTFRYDWRGIYNAFYCSSYKSQPCRDKLITKLYV